jgi:hypothetical protein
MIPFNLHRGIPLVRRPFYQRDMAMAERDRIADEQNSLIEPGVPFGQEQIAQEAQFITTFSKFTNGTTDALSWPLMNGTEVTFTTTQQCLNCSEQAAMFVAAVEVSEANGALPSASATIP